MRVSLQWLKEWVNVSLSASDLAARLTMVGLEVGAVHAVAGEFNGVVVAHVLKTTPHPKADKLTLCEVDAGQHGHLRIVCGAANVRNGLKVALALPGAKLPGGIEIKETVLRGEPSQGMLCSVSELGMEDHSEGILELAADAPIGVNFIDYLQLDDQVLDIELTPNRADCLSIRGIAREVSAIYDLPLNAPSIHAVPPQTDEKLRIEQVNPNACPCYVGRVIRGINPNASTPPWMKERLRRGGVRSIHPVVDITNYVMLELGQPMHAFDKQKMNGDSITVRFSEPQESLRLLDGQTVTLDNQVLVIADETGPLAIAGVMGGEKSAVTEETTDIFLESAYFNPLAITGVARRYGVSSDSAQRFERGVDPSLAPIAMERATELLLKWVGGTPGPAVLMRQEDTVLQARTLVFDPAKVKMLTGVDVTPEYSASILERLGFQVNKEVSPWLVEVPIYRVDVQLEVDLIEEVIRIVGYENIRAETIVTDVKAGQTMPSLRLSSDMANFLCARGFNETISYSFVDPDLQQMLQPTMQPLNLVNPISSELASMRVSLWPGLLASMLYNLHRQHALVKIFEIGVIFDNSNGALCERNSVAGLITGEHGSLNWSEPKRKLDFYDLKGELEALADFFKVDALHFVPSHHPSLHPGQSARILVNQEEAGWLGTLHPKLMDEMGLTDEVVLFEMTLEHIHSKAPVRYKTISKYPQIRRDLSFLVDRNVHAKQIEDIVISAVASDSLLKAFHVFDVYMGPTIPTNKKSIAIALTLQDDKRTLTDTEINTVIAAIIKKLDKEFTIILRD